MSETKTFKDDSQVIERHVIPVPELRDCNQAVETIDKLAAVAEQCADLACDIRGTKMLDRIDRISQRCVELAEELAHNGFGPGKTIDLFVVSVGRREHVYCSNAEANARADVATRLDPSAHIRVEKQIAQIK